VLLEKEQYPEGILENLQEKIENVKVVDAAQIARNLGNIRAQNIVLLGVLIKALGLEDTDWVQVLKEYVPTQLQELNIKALQAGMAS